MSLLKLLAIALVCVLGGSVVATEPKKSAAPSALDDELFKGLDDATTAPGVKPKGETPAKDAVTKPSPEKPASPNPAGAKPQSGPTNPLDEELLKQLEGDDAAGSKPKQSKPTAGGEGGGKATTKPDSDDPFQRLAEQIRDAEARLRRTDSGDETQQLQKKIVDDLEKLIAQIEQQQQQQKSSSSQQQKSGSSQQKTGSQQQPGQSQQGSRESSQARDSQDGPRGPTARKLDPGNLKSLLEKAWGTLPERERQAVMQTSVDDFPAKYQFVIEEYFKALLKREE